MKNRLISIFAGIFFVALVMHAFDKNGVGKNTRKAPTDEQGHASTALLQLLTLTGVEHDGSLSSIVQATQAAWIRKPGTERWDIVEQDWKQRDVMIDLFLQMGLVDSVALTKTSYDYALLMGAAYPCVQDRIEQLVELWKQGIRFNQIVILSGARPLTESEKKLVTKNYNLFEGDFIPSTEADIMKFIYEKIEIPASMRSVLCIVIDVPMKITKDGTLVRPTTGDTIDLWMESKPSCGSCLVVSNQPYVQYQDSVVKTLVPKGFNIDTFGIKSNDTKIDVYLDTVARYLYQEKKRLQL